MADLTQKLLSNIRQYRLEGIDLQGEFIYPQYAGGSILNLPGTICRLLGASGLGAVPLKDELLGRLGGPYRRVLLIVMDALALHRLQRWMLDGAAPVWEGLAREGMLAPLTSIVPSTTSAALTSLWTGRSAAEHGITGYEMWLKEYGIVANTILQSPISYHEDAGSLSRAGFSPETFLPFTTLGSHLESQGVHTYAFQHYSILRSGLSQMYFRDVRTQAFFTASDLWVNLRRFMETNPGERQYIYVYWSEIDTLSHRYGPDDERVGEEFASFSSAFERLFLDRLRLAGQQDTLLILTADHGQIATPPDPYYELRSHPNLTRRLHILPTGENRLAFLYVRPGQTEAVREYLERTWPNQFTVLDSAYVVDAGLFGTARHLQLLDRVGDFILVARGAAYWWWSSQENHIIGRHGGLHPEEMLVPFLAVKI